MFYKILTVAALASFEIYAAIPAGFAFENNGQWKSSNDDPIVDNPELEDYNLDARIDAFMTYLNGRVSKKVYFFLGNRFFRQFSA